MRARERIAELRRAGIKLERVLEELEARGGDELERELVLAAQVFARAARRSAGRARLGAALKRSRLPGKGRAR